MPGMPIPSPGERVKDVRVHDDMLTVDLADGRTISVPLAWDPRLLHATGAQRANWRVAGGGFDIHWPELDMELAIEKLAAHVGYPIQELIEVANGRAPVDARLAWLLSMAFGTSPEFWLNLQLLHDLTVSRPTRRVTSLSR